MKRLFLIFLVVLQCAFLCGCVSLSIPGQEDQEQEEGGDKKDEGEKKEEKKKERGPLSFDYFAFLKEDNPSLERDIVCSDLLSTSLLMIPDFEIKLPCTLKARFTVTNGDLIYNGDVLESGAGEIYISDKQDAMIRIVGDRETLYRKIVLFNFTGLPAVEINCGAGIGDNWSDASVVFHGMGKYKDTGSGKVQLKRSSDVTAWLDKESFDIKFAADSSVFGMPEADTWSFLANYRDRSLLRNDLAFEAGYLADALAWTPRYVFAEVILNGKHMGLYQVTETVRRNKDRVPVEPLAPTDIDAAKVSGGYIVEIDNKYNSVFKFKTNGLDWPVNVKYPSEDDINGNQFIYIRDYVNDMEEALLGGNYALVRQMMDYPSFVDMFIVEQVMGNTAFCDRTTVFCYKKRGGKLYAGPVWGFDNKSLVSETDQKVQRVLWYPYLLQDPTFVSALKSRWPVLKKKFESSLYGHLESRKTELAKPAAVNDRIFPLEGKDFGNLDANLTFEQSVDRLSAALKARIAATDVLIAAF